MLFGAFLLKIFFVKGTNISHPPPVISTEEAHGQTKAHNTLNLSCHPNILEHLHDFINFIL